MLILRCIALLGAIATCNVDALAAPPSLVPLGWRQVTAAGTARVFVSPDGAARIRFGHEAAHSFDKTAFTSKSDEQVTYQEGGKSWFVVSGYRGPEIFYRKGNLACGGSRWNLIEFRYPRGAKREMDAAVVTVAHNMGAYRNDCG
ncbi:hypothetical protein [Rhodoplanes sp. Z2-YC6860]|uniref:hypothetical protein n=1 Tax=Rhodoplanes sp. Z2-YC6860 TaxID=674703 RepID=UPI00078E9699|nr:hypothetical protein [Rhodoplanes sp. Z2-YC6860]AMN40472.1 hypothetical protein RHPLAN_20280 [Rhodoplanes sp. Z2-YC6860]